MNKHVILFTICCAAFAWSCNDDPATNTATTSGPSTTADYAKLGKAFCECAQPSIELNRKMQALTEAGKRDEFVKMAGEVGKEFTNTLACCQQKKQSLTTAELDTDKLLGEIRTQCPEIPDKLSLQLAQKIE